MTRITKLVLHGFKSFAKRTELVFDGNFSVVLGPNGSGKCVTGDTLVHLADGSLVEIGKLVAEAFSRQQPRPIDDGSIGEGNGCKVLCLDTNSLKVTEKEISHYVRRKSPEKLLKIVTRSGRSITATPYHPLFVLSEGKVTAAKAEELKEGVRVAVPRIVKVSPKTSCFYEFLDLIKPEDSIFVPFNPAFAAIVKEAKKGREWQQFAAAVGVPKMSISGLLGGQSVNFSHLVKILRYAGKSDDEIIEFIPEVKGKTTGLACKIPWHNTPELSRLLGYLLAEGRLPLDVGQVWFTNGTEEIVKDYACLISSVFGLRATVNEYKPDTWDVLAYSHPAQIILSKLGMGFYGTGSKTITNAFLRHSTDEDLANLLNGLYSGDGYVSDRSIELTTKSKNLATAVESILTRLGIRFISKWQVKIATNSGFSGLYKTIYAYGVTNASRFQDVVRFVHPEKRRKLSILAAKKSNPNVDLLEVNQLVKSTAKELGLNVKNLKSSNPKLDAYCYNTCLPTVEGTQQLISLLFDKSAKAADSQSLMKLKKLAHSSIYWDEIVEISEVQPKDEWVYDLCVEKDHNFIANNIFVHNSNILDSLCFVLGRISSKDLRTEKLAHLIYNGGKTKQPATKAEVSIFFDNSKKTFPYPDPQVKVSRIIKPSGQSVYRINDNASSRQEILDLLALAKIDPNGHNIVLQGDIIHFCEMSAEERRQVIEEIAGISVYEEKKNKALSELGKVDERLKEAEILLSERKTHLKELKHDRDQALKYKELNDNIRSNRATYLHLQIKQRDSKKGELEKSIALNEKEITDLKAEIEKLRLAVVKKKEEIAALNEELEQRAEQEQVAIHKNIEQLRVSIGTNTSRVSLSEGEIVKIKERREQLKHDLVDTESKISQLENAKGSIAEQVKKLSADRAKLTDNISKLKGTVNSSDLVRIESELGAIDKETEEKQQLIQAMVEQKQNLLREKDQLEFRINTIDSSMDKLKEVEKENKKEIGELQQQRQDFKRMVLELNQLLAKDSTVSARIGENRKRIFALTEEVAKARAKEIAIQERALGNLAVKSILSQKMRGVFGTVSQLGKAKSKYALALETAAGPRINSIIVESDTVAAECIKMLKSKKIGTAAFLPLNKIRQADERSDVNELLKLPGVHGLAISLISFEEHYKPAFSYVFGNTIVVDSIDVARKIGVGRARMVTLDGDLTELSGAMHGGYREVRKDAMGFVDEEEVQVAAQLEKKLESLTLETSDLDKEKESVEAAITSLRERKAVIEGDIIKAERSLHLESSDVDVSKKQKQELQETLKNVAEKLRGVEEKLLEQTRLTAELKSKRMAIREQITSMRNPAFLAELNALEKKSKELSDMVQALENESKNNDVQINEVYSQEKSKHLQILKQLDRDEERFTEEKDRLLKELEKARKDLSEGEAKAAKFQARHKELFAKRTKFQEDVQSDDEKIIRKEEQINTIEIKLNNVSIKKAEVSAELSGLQEEFSQYSDAKLIEGLSEDQLKYEISKFEKLVVEMGNVNLKALEIYDDVEKQYNELLDKKDKLGKEKDDVLKMINEIESRKKDLFMNTFTVLNQNFANIFQQLSTKGAAHLLVENEENPFEAGVRIRVNLSGEKFMDLRSLSGGEKTMTALALIFAIQDYEPASFYIFDEVDAALDKRNSEKLAKLVKKYSERAQYIVISHNDALMAEGETLYGVSMDEHGMSNVVSLKV